MFVLNICISGLLKNRIIKSLVKLRKISESYSAQTERYLVLERERQELARRDRIVNYAQHNLGMKLLKPDQIASGDVIKEIKENYSRDNVLYCFIDFLSPSANAFEIK